MATGWRGAGEGGRLSSTGAEVPDTEALPTGKPHLPETLFLFVERSFDCIVQREGKGDAFLSPGKSNHIFPATHASLGVRLQFLAFSEEGASREEGREELT